MDHAFNLPMVILEPQSACDWDANNIDTFVKYAMSHYKIDPKRLYISGISLGGGGVSFYLDAHYDKVAAALPLCANAEYKLASTPQNLVNNGVAIWSAVAQDDTTVGYYQSFEDVTKVWAAMGLDGSQLNSIFPSYPGVDSTGYFTPSNKKWAWTPGQTYKLNGTAISPPYIVTIYQSGGHEVWDRMFSDRNVYDFLLSHHK